MRLYGVTIENSIDRAISEFNYNNYGQISTLD